MMVGKAVWKSLSRALALSALALLAAPGPARAALAVAADGYSLELPDTWQIFGRNEDGNTIALTRTGLESYLSFYTEDGDPTPLLEQLDITLSYGVIKPDAITARGTKTLGKYSFEYYEMKLDSSAKRTRLYRAVQGNTQFNAGLAYEIDSGSSLVSELEQALATLTFSGGSAVRPIALQARPRAARADHDALGRFRTAAPAQRLFRSPAP